MKTQKQSPDEQKAKQKSDEDPVKPETTAEGVQEIGGRKGPDPVRYGDWENNGKCVDF